MNEEGNTNNPSGEGVQNESNTTQEAAQHTAPQQNNTLMAILAYLGFLVIIPMVTDSKDEPFVKFHIKQGLVLLITWVIAFFVGMVPIVGWILSPFIILAMLILMIIGIINAAGGKQTKLPLVGSFAEKINF